MCDKINQQRYDCAEMKDVKGELNKKNEEIETMELIIEENKKEIDRYDVKVSLAGRHVVFKNMSNRAM